MDMRHQVKVGELGAVSRVLVDLRPALDGFFGIPQETRLLFSALEKLSGVETIGLLQMSTRVTKGGIGDVAVGSESARIYLLSKTVISLKGPVALGWVGEAWTALENLLARGMLRLSSIFPFLKIRLRRFETKYFGDFIWRYLFSKSVPARERKNVLRANHLICPVPWRWMHAAGLGWVTIFKKALYPTVNTVGIDVFLAQTPYPAKVSKNTALVIHYHDAIPVFMPHTIKDRAFHQASHFRALESNVKSGAWFVCVSEATRSDLVSIFPEAESRAVTIHNMLSEHYYPSFIDWKSVLGAVRRHLWGEFVSKNGREKWSLSRIFKSDVEKNEFYESEFSSDTNFILMVSTIEPRKNHIRLLEAWHVLRERVDPSLKLILVGHIGWDYKETLDACVPGVEQGGIFMLHSVPSDSLRALYSAALVTVCPSVGEGFDFSGVEAMRCGGVTLASDIPVHREVYGEAARYFDPYSSESLVAELKVLLEGEAGSELRDEMRKLGTEKSAEYLPERILPQWSNFIDRIMLNRSTASRSV